MAKTNKTDYLIFQTTLERKNLSSRLYVHSKKLCGEVENKNRGRPPTYMRTSPFSTHTNYPSSFPIYLYLHNYELSSLAHFCGASSIYRDRQTETTLGQSVVICTSNVVLCRTIILPHGFYHICLTFMKPACYFKCRKCTHDEKAAPTLTTLSKPATKKPRKVSSNNILVLLYTNEWGV